METDNEMYDSKDMDMIQMMLTIAGENNLQCEVVTAFAYALKNSSASVEESIHFSLIEWDLI